MILLPGKCFIVPFLLLCGKHVVDISHFVLYFILCDMYVLPIGVINNNNNNMDCCQRVTLAAHRP